MLGLAGGELGGSFGQATELPPEEVPLVPLKIPNPSADVSKLSVDEQKAKAKKLLFWGLGIGIPLVLLISAWNAYHTYRKVKRLGQVVKGEKSAFGIW